MYAIRYKHSVSLLLLDVDNFKDINDNFGHQFGDFVLRNTALLIKGSVRNTDLVARCGGDEIAIILLEADNESAFEISENLREKVQRHSFRSQGKDLKVTVSLGVATAPGKGIKDWESLLRTADQAMYRAKKAGKNCVVPFRPDGLTKRGFLPAGIKRSLFKASLQKESITCRPTRRHGELQIAMEQEKRRSPRLDFRLKVILEGRTKQGEIGEILDFSPHGAFIHLPDPSRLKKNDALKLLMKLPPEEKTLRIKARVVFVTGKGIGVEFKDVSPHDAVELDYCFEVFKGTLPLYEA